MELGLGCSQECTLSQFAVLHACLVIQWWFISLVHEGPDIRTSPAIYQAGDLLLWKLLYGTPPPLPLAIPSLWPWSLAVTYRISWGKMWLWSLSLPLKQDAQVEPALFAGRGVKGESSGWRFLWQSP